MMRPNPGDTGKISQCVTSYKIVFRAHHVGTMVRRNKSDQKYSGAFVGEKVQPSISDIKGGGGAPAPNLLPPNQNNQPRPYPVPNQIIQKPVEPPKPLIPIIPGKFNLIPIAVFIAI